MAVQNFVIRESWVGKQLLWLEMALFSKKSTTQISVNSAKIYF